MTLPEQVYGKDIMMSELDARVLIICVESEDICQDEMEPAFSHAAPWQRGAQRPPLEDPRMLGTWQPTGNKIYFLLPILGLSIKKGSTSGVCV